MVKSNSKAEVDRITKGLQEVVKHHYLANEDPETLTINNIRSQAEQALNLKTDFLKNDSFWKSLSKKVIREEVDRQNNEIEQAAKKQESSEPPKASKDVDASKAADTPRDGGFNKGAPRKAQRGKKRGKSSVSSKPVAAENGGNTKSKGEAENNDIQAEDTSPQNKRRRTKVHSEVVEQDVTERDTKGSEDNQHFADSNKEEISAPPPPPPPAEGNGSGSPSSKPVKDMSESEMSEVLDLLPQKKKRSNSKSKTELSKKRSSKAASKKQTKKKEVEPLSADEEKIKSLQGWLLKCGIRKIWGRELKKFSTSKEKIQHLKGLLEGIGMTGRYSAEKAKRIKEERELAAEVEAVQADASSWGLEGSDKVQTRASRSAPIISPTTRRLVRPELAFLEDQSDSDE